MKIPDETIFSANPWGEGSISYKQARLVTDEIKKIELIKNRLDVFLIGQIQPIGELKEDSTPKIWSPFPLTHLTFLAIETLGRIISSKEKIEVGNNFESSKKYSKPIYQLIDKRLLDKPDKTFYKSLNARLGYDDKKNIKCFADIFHKYMRNTYNHGFQGKLVYLNHELSVGWTKKDGYLILNPYWLWREYVRVYSEVFTVLLDKSDEKYFHNALSYFDELIQ